MNFPYGALMKVQMAAMLQQDLVIQQHAYGRMKGHFL